MAPDDAQTHIGVAALPSAFSHSKQYHRPMYLLSSQQIRDLDRFTIEHEPIAGIDLMERAARSLFAEVVATEPHRHVTIICGMGNNGGDGLALARMMQGVQGCQVSVVIVDHTDSPSADFSINLERLKTAGVFLKELNHVSEMPEIPGHSMVIDALLGTGLSRPMTGLLAEVVGHINALPNRVVSIDIPSGLFSDGNGANDPAAIVRADRTLTFHCPKLAFMFAENAPFVGDFTVLDIGLMEQESGLRSEMMAVTQELASDILRPRARFSHKGTYGHALLLAGHYGSMGAAVLAARAVMRSGAGLLTAHLPSEGVDVMQTAVPEAMCSIDPHPHIISQTPKLVGFSAIGMGPGIGREEETANVLKMLVQDTKVPMVLDADALNILSENPTWLRFLPKGTVLTPHPKEFDRLAGRSDSGYERWQLQRDFAKRHNCTVVLKGAFTSICNPAGQTFFNLSGNPGMATAGSGDVLTGIILGLLSQGYGPTEAAVLGVYLHGLSGDLVAEHSGLDAMIASDLVKGLGAAFLHLVNG
jgi:ADP-dependent NAD(P)H-hydrate dehydratase / NAD(P)H-hydrate epimerase